MLKQFFVFLIFVLMMSCDSSSELNDYFGQPKPGTTPVIFGEGVISKKGRFEHGISFASDANELAFGILNKDDSGAIYHAKKLNGNWTAPVVFEPLKNESAFLPYFTPDGKSLLYAQSNPDTGNSYATDIWKIEKENDKWNEPEKMKAPIRSISREANASMASDGTIYFSSNRNCEGQENCFTADLFYAERTNGSYQAIKELSELNSAGDEESVFISPDEKYILFCRFTDMQTMMDLYISYRDHQNNWTEPMALDSTINSQDWDRRPYVSSDDKFLFFTRLQIGDEGLTESDIYWVNTSKVFAPYVFNSISDITLKVGEPFEISIPVDYFKDIDDDQLTLSVIHDQHDWLKFESDKMKLSGSPTSAGTFELKMIAVDEFSNRVEDKVVVTVKE